jgi:hypothetical protein
MATLTKEVVRARIIVGGHTIFTPDVVSFNVSRSRKQMCATFSASVKTGHTSLGGITGSEISIAAGSDGILKTIFTGFVEKATISPIRTDASKVMLNMSGRDVLMLLDGRNVTRRASNTGLPMFAMVNSVIRHDVQKMQKFPERVYNNQQHVVADMGNFPNITIPEAFRTVPPIDNARSNKTIGVLSIEKVVS